MRHFDNYGRYFSLPDKFIRGKIDDLLEFARLAEKRYVKVDTLSGGIMADGTHQYLLNKSGNTGLIRFCSKRTTCTSYGEVVRAGHHPSTSLARRSSLEDVFLRLTEAC